MTTVSNCQEIPSMKRQTVLSSATTSVHRKSSAIKPRFILLDLLRSAALLSMAIFHFAYDLQFFGVLPAGTTSAGGWEVFARSIAASFLFLAGFSLYLAHGRKLNTGPFLRRLGLLSASAALVSGVSFFVFPDQMVHFGILHCIAVSSVLGLLFLRQSSVLIVAVAFVFLAAPELLRSEVFNHTFLYWLGFSTQTPSSLDFEPIFPWFAPFLLGLALAKEFTKRGFLLGSPSKAHPNRITKILAWPGRHSLMVYLVHQPVLLALIWMTLSIIGMF